MICTVQDQTRFIKWVPRKGAGHLGGRSGDHDADSRPDGLPLPGKDGVEATVQNIADPCTAGIRIIAAGQGLLPPDREPEASGRVGPLEPRS